MLCTMNDLMCHVRSGLSLSVDTRVDWVWDVGVEWMSYSCWRYAGSCL